MGKSINVRLVTDNIKFNISELKSKIRPMNIKIEDLKNELNNIGYNLVMELLNFVNSHPELYHPEFIKIVNNCKTIESVKFSNTKNAYRIKFSENKYPRRGGFLREGDCEPSSEHVVLVPTELLDDPDKYAISRKAQLDKIKQSSEEATISRLENSIAANEHRVNLLKTQLCKLKSAM
jgi:predicted ribosome quality control (RQC) complex YloA/Tae2 family protein